MPTVDRGRLDQYESRAPPRLHPSQAEPEQAVRGAETSMGTREDTELMTKSEDLESAARAAPSTILGDHRRRVCCGNDNTGRRDHSGCGAAWWRRCARPWPHD